MFWRTRYRSAYCACLLCTRYLSASWPIACPRSSTICTTMKFAKLFVHALLAVVFVQTGSASVQGEYEETGQCEVLLVLVVKNIQSEKTSCAHYYSKKSDKKGLVSMYTLCRKRPLYYMGLTLMGLSMGISKTRNGTHRRMAASVCVLCSNCVYCVLQVTKIVDEGCL